jgi:hypothetical protein
MKGREGELNRLHPKLNSLCIQIPLSKMFLTRIVVPIPKYPHRIPTFWATLAHYKGHNIFILLRSWFNDVASHVGMSL